MYCTGRSSSARALELTNTGPKISTTAAEREVSQSQGQRIKLTRLRDFADCNLWGLIWICKRDVRRHVHLMLPATQLQIIPKFSIFGPELPRFLSAFPPI